jgi:hypothetical protein
MKVVSAFEKSMYFYQTTDKQKTIHFTSQKVVPSKFYLHVRFEGFKVVTVKNAVFWDVTPCRSFEPTFRRNVSPPSSGQKTRERGTSVSRWLQTACFSAGNFKLKTWKPHYGASGHQILYKSHKLIYQTFRRIHSSTNLDEHRVP